MGRWGGEKRLKNLKIAILMAAPVEPLQVSPADAQKALELKAAANSIFKSGRVRTFKSN